MLDWLAIYVNYSRGENNGSTTVTWFKIFVGIFVFGILFYSIKWIGEITGIFTFLQWVFSSYQQGGFEKTLATVLFLFFIALVIVMIRVVFNCISSFSATKENEGNKKRWN